MPVAFGKPGSGRATGEQTKAAAGEIFKCEVSECGGLPVKADGGAPRPHPQRQQRSAFPPCSRECVF